MQTTQPSSATIQPTAPILAPSELQAIQLGTPHPPQDYYPKWPHIENIEKIPTFLSNAQTNKTALTVTEKIHGFNARFGRTEQGEFWVGSRNNVVTEGNLQGAVDMAQERERSVPMGFTFYGEWAGKGIQKGIDYGEKKFYLFGVRANADLLPWIKISHWAIELGLETVPLIYWGRSETITIAQLDKWRQGTSRISPEQNLEGIVITTEPMSFDEYGHTLIAKFKHPKFAEIAHVKRKKQNGIDQTNAQAFVDKYATDNRLDHIFDPGDWEGLGNPLDMSNMGTVLRAYYNDVIREAGDDINGLSPEEQKILGRLINAKVKPFLDAKRLDSLQVATDVTT